MKELSNIKISDYEKDFGNLNKKWLIKNKIPNYFWKRFSNVQNDITVIELLFVIDKKLIETYGKKKKDTAKSFADSRFTPLSQMLERGMVSCGATAIIFTSVLRNFNIPVKLVHGRIKGQTGTNRHAWLKIYNPKTKKWIIVDPTQNHRNFKQIKNSRQLKIYSNWKDMKEDYNNGKF